LLFVAAALLGFALSPDESSSYAAKRELDIIAQLPYKRFQWYVIERERSQIASALERFGRTIPITPTVAVANQREIRVVSLPSFSNGLTTQCSVPGLACFSESVNVPVLNDQPEEFVPPGRPVEELITKTIRV
jgi:hypothetical protein